MLSVLLGIYPRHSIDGSYVNSVCDLKMLQMFFQGGYLMSSTAVYNSIINHGSSTLQTTVGGHYEWTTWCSGISENDPWIYQKNGVNSQVRIWAQSRPGPVLLLLLLLSPSTVFWEDWVLVRICQADFCFLFVLVQSFCGLKHVMKVAFIFTCAF